MSFTIGQTVGPYRITEKLGQGGMATVYKAYHANLDRYVAIKVLHVAFRQDESFLERFKREAQIVARLEHTHIVPIYDYADFEGQPYLVMKFLEGETLKKRMRHQPLSLEDIPPILNPVASALDYAHRHDVLHRDVKPSNIVIDKDNTPFLADFGLARIASTGESTLSQDMMLGTPQYISPEQAQGNQHLDAGTDIYSLGVVLYEIVAGRVPFSADTPYSIIHDHIYTPLPLPSQVNPNVPASVETVLLKALSKQRTDRYQTAGDLAKAFTKAIETHDSESIQIQTSSKFSDTSEAIEIDLASSAVKTTLESPEVIPVQKVGGAAPSQPAIPPRPPIHTPTPPPQPAIPAPTPFPPHQMGGTPPPGSILVPGSSVVNKQQSRGNIWAIGGCAIFILTCLLSIGIVMKTANDPHIKSRANAADIPLGQQILEEARNGDLTHDQADTYVEDYPNEPAAHFALALTQLEQDDSDAARDTIATVFNDLNPSSETISDWVDVMDEMGYKEDAILLYITAIADDTTNMTIRNQAGSYIYSQAENTTAQDIEVFCNLVDSYPQIAFFEAMLGQALISANIQTFDGNLPTTCLNYADNEGFETVEDLITHSIEVDEQLAEGYLILGNYYQSQEDTEMAISNWTTAAELPDAPSWVKTRAQNHLDAQPN